jgi:hypothetical protein
MIVTSERGSQVYGRDFRQGNPTHRCAADIVAKFDSEKEVLGAIDKINEIEDHFNPILKELNEKIREAHRARQRQIAELMRVESST